MQHKILYIITKGNWGGAQKYVFELSRAMKNAGRDVSVACGEGEILPAKLAAEHIPVLQIKNLARDIHIINDIRVFFSLLKLLRKEHPHTVHLNSAKIGGLGAFAARLVGIPRIVFTVHGFAFNEARPWWQKKIIVFLSWLSIVFSTDVIFISKQELMRALEWPFIRKKARLIYNGITKPEFLTKTEARKRLTVLLKKPESFFDGKTIVGTIAELTANKGLSYAIDAAEKMPEISYVIIGRGELLETLQKIITEKKLNDRIFLAGFIENASVYMPAFDMFLLPSIKEGLPYVLLEAGLAHVPAISTAVGAIPEIIDSAECGILISPKSSDDIVKAVSETTNNPAHAERRAAELHQKVSSAFSFESMLEETKKVYGK